MRSLSLLLIAPLLGCGADPTDRPSIVLVLVDQLRKDWADEWMPETSRLAADGVRFESVRSAAPWTYPSVISMFSGLYPQQHGADGNPGVSPDDPKVLSTFERGVPLLPRTLGPAYHTAGFVTNPFLHTWNPLHEAFDHYEVDRFIGSQGAMRGHPELVWTDEMFADSVNAAVEEYFDTRGAPTTPEFVYVHYIDVHGPWEGAPFESGGALEKDTALEVRETATRYVDGKIVELYEYFTSRYGGDLYFVVTSDHGMEEPGELDWEVAGMRQRKGTVHDFNTHIPLLFLPSRHASGGRIVPTPCSNVDVAPTLLAAAGLSIDQRLAGRSLLPALRGEDLPEVPVYSLMSCFGRRNDCVVLGERKLMRHLDPRTGEVGPKLVYDLARDPEERDAETGGFGEDGRLLLEAAGTRGISFPKHYDEVDEELLRKLQTVGYLGDE